jgi:hypothetical protein
MKKSYYNLLSIAFILVMSNCIFANPTPPSPKEILNVLQEHLKEGDEEDNVVLLKNDVTWFCWKDKNVALDKVNLDILNQFVKIKNRKGFFPLALTVTYMKKDDTEGFGATTLLENNKNLEDTK